MHKLLITLFIMLICISACKKSGNTPPASTPDSTTSEKPNDTIVTSFYGILSTTEYDGSIRTYYPTTQDTMIVTDWGNDSISFSGVPHFTHTVLKNDSGKYRAPRRPPPDGLYDGSITYELKGDSVTAIYYSRRVGQEQTITIFLGQK